MDAATYPRHIVAVSGLFRNDAGQILLVKTPLRGWEFPGGQVEQGEDLFQTLAREVREESGCIVQVQRLVGVYSNPAPPEKVMLVFTGRHLSGTPRPGDETVDAGWFTVEKAIQAVTNLPDAAKLRDALVGSDRPVYRVYTTRPYVVHAEFSL